MNNNQIRVPFISEKFINKKAQEFRDKFWDGSIPVDIEKIIEIKLAINIIPVLEMARYCDTDALISSDWKNIYADNEKFCDERYYNRLRFSFAHEIGHMMLHEQTYKDFCIKEVKDFYALIENIDEQQYGYLETQANKFASALLLPREMLIQEANDQYRELNKDFDFSSISLEKITPYLAIPISKKFGVSQKTAEIALGGLRLKRND